MTSVIQYPKNAYFIIANSGTVELGSFETTGGDFRLAHLRIFHRKTGAYSYTMRLVVSSKVGGPELCTSETVTFSDVTTGQATSDWLGDISLDMPDYNLLSGETYFMRLELTGYTRPAIPLENTAYLGVWCDWLEPIGLTNTGGARIAMGVMR